MFYVYLFLVIWLPTSAYMLGHDIWRHWKSPWLENRRTEGMISLTKTQQYLVMGFWPFALVGLVGWLIFGTLSLVAQACRVQWRERRTQEKKDVK